MHTAPPDGMTFDPTEPEKRIRFCEMFYHVKGPLAARDLRIKLEDWQKFFIYEVFGWTYYNEEFGTTSRLYNEAVLMVPRKNGKTTLLALLANYELVFSDQGAEIYSAATKREQAAISFDHSRDLMEKLREQHPESFDVFAPYRPTAHQIKFGRNVFKPLASTSRSLDGLNPSLNIIDEAGAIDDQRLYDVVLSGAASRPDAVSVQISTAYSSTVSPFAKKVSALADYHAHNERPELDYPKRVFGLIYIPDDDDDDDDPQTWRKVNPNFGISVTPDYIQTRFRETENDRAGRIGVLMKHLNKVHASEYSWVGPEVTALGERTEAEWEPVERSRYQGVTVLGIDLSMSQDLSAVASLTELPDRHFAFSVQLFSNHAYYQTMPKFIRDIYDDAVDRDILYIADGHMVDYDKIEGAIRADYDLRNAKQIVVDWHNSFGLVGNLKSDGYEILPTRTSFASMSDCTKELTRAFVEGRVQWPECDMIKWQMSNVVEKRNDNSDVLLKKDKRKPFFKIDAISALAYAMKGLYNLPEELGAFGFVEIDL